MTASRNRLFASMLVGALFAPACTGASAPSGPSPRTPTEASMEELEAIARARADSALMDVSDADVEFMRGMIHHHAQALVMSGYAPGNGASPSIQVLAARIINAQKDEIALMQRWLRDRGQRAPVVSDEGHVEGGHANHMQMAGMLTPAQLEELAAARDSTFDRLFLEYMIQHHEGAVTMVLDLFETDGAAQDDSVFKLASDIQVDQITEVARMRTMLNAMSSPETKPESHR
jgi:uncharacterized protein (DUF305 family)